MMVHAIGVVLTILGLILTSAGVLGKERLTRWETGIRYLSLRYKPLDALNKFKDNLEARYGSSLFSVFFGVMGFLIIWSLSISFLSNFISNNLSRSLLIVGFVIFALTLAGLALYISFWGLGTIVLVIIWLPLIPYALFDRLVVKHKMESTLALIGILLSVAGVLFLEIL